MLKITSKINSLTYISDHSDDEEEKETHADEEEEKLESRYFDEAFSKTRPKTSNKSR
mgnify:CR=1 FL=1